MIDIQLKELTKDDILFRLKQYDLWNLEDIVLFAFGYEHQDVCWDIIIDQSNQFPIRQYNSALEAINNPNTKNPLSYVHKEPFSSQFVACKVKKGTFIKWARKNWPEDPRVEKVYNIWRYYKSNNASVALSSGTDEAKIKNYGDKLQVQEYLAHLQTGSSKKYHANITKLAKQTLKELGIPHTLSTYRKYIKRMTEAELAQYAKANIASQAK